MTHYSLEQDYRQKKRGGGVCLYIHESLQYQLRKDLRIGKDSESINSLFIEIDKLTIGTKYNVINGLHLSSSMGQSLRFQGFIE